MPRTDLISYSDLARECGVSNVAVRKFVLRNGLDFHRLPYSPAGLGLAPAEAKVVRDYYEAKRKNKARRDKFRLRLVSA
jgi:hypothetical protein